LAVTKIRDEQAAQSVSLTAEVTGVLPIANGGTNNTTNAAASCTGNSATATALATARRISGVSFDGSADITVTGFLAPVQGVTRGDETFTVVGGSVTQITGTTISGGAYAPAVGNRLLISNAPASTGVGSGAFTASTQPGNGIYVVTGNTTNLSVSRAADMSLGGSPAGMYIFAENNGMWGANNLWYVDNPANTATAFTWGATNVHLISAISAVGMSPYSLTVGSGQVTLTGASFNTIIAGNAGIAAPQTLTLPVTTTDTLLSRNSIDVVTGKSISYDQITSLTAGNTSTQSQVVVSGTSYYVTGSALTVPTNVAVGTRFRWTVAMAKTAAGTGAFAIRSIAAPRALLRTPLTCAVHRYPNRCRRQHDGRRRSSGHHHRRYRRLLLVDHPHQQGDHRDRVRCRHRADRPVLRHRLISRLNTASLKFGLAFKATTGTPTITVPMVRPAVVPTAT
jgi:hypothetical protein